MVLQLVVQFCILIAVFVPTSCQEYMTVNTISGKIRGVVETYGDEKMYQFRGIPYAKPPVGDLRFKKPQPYGSWNYTLDAINDTSPCMQQVGGGLTTNDRVSEDCLFLNIHVPRNVSASNNKTVMVWIHGGGYTAGQGSSYDGSYLALEGDVIVVTLNYRLGLFGFLCTYDQASPGNYGLWDQIMAMEWVKFNIPYFGGNPSLITIFGESAGGFSVSYQTIIPSNRGLFQRVIAQSGVSFSSPINTESRELLHFIAEKLYCNFTNTHALVKCLRQKPPGELVRVTDEFQLVQGLKLDLSMTVGPCLDGDLLSTEPNILLSDKTSPAYKFFRSLDYMAGTTDGEGSLFLSTIIYVAQQPKINPYDGISTKFLCEVFSHRMAEIYFKNATGTAKALCQRYSVDGGNTNKLAEQGIKIVNMFGDIYFVSPTVRTLIDHSEDSNERKTFHYLFTRAFQGTFGFYLPSWFKQSAHATELAYLFGAEGMFKTLNWTLTSDDLTLEDKMCKYWTNFAKSGDPNSDSLPTWKEYGRDQNYLQLDLNISSHKELYSDRMKFLLEEIPKIMKQTAETSSSPSSRECCLQIQLYVIVAVLITYLTFTENFV